MTSSIPSRENRIAKNTVYLYLRMMVNMIITIYSSRIILDALGVEDYGIYNIVAGVIVMFSFVSTSMNASTQRYLNSAMGSEDKETLKKVFFNSLIIYIVLAAFLFLICEIIGQIFILDNLNIPENKKNAASIVYHISTLTFCINILRTPYNALVIAYERMGFYAITSIVESVLRLIAALLLSLFLINRLEYFTLFIGLISILLIVWYIIYCNKNLSPDYKWNFVSGMVKNISMFTFWNMFGGFADVGFTQGTNLILNLFYGVTLNTAYGLGMQIRNAIFAFVSNLQVAANPQIVKSYAKHDIDYFTKLVYLVSKYSFFLMYIISLPLIFKIKYILDLWLVETPEYTTGFVFFIIILILFDSLHGPLWTAMQAYGKIRNYQLVISFIILMNLPFTYLVLKFGFSPVSVIVVQIIFKILVLIARLLYAKKYCYISLTKYFKTVVRPIIIVSMISVPIISLIANYIPDSLTMVVLFFIISFLIISSLVFCLAMNKSEKRYLLSIIKNKLPFIKKRL